MTLLRIVVACDISISGSTRSWHAGLLSLHATSKSSTSGGSCLFSEVNLAMAKRAMFKFKVVKLAL